MIHGTTMTIWCVCSLIILAGVPAYLAQCPEPKCYWDCGLDVRSDGCAHCDCRYSPLSIFCPNMCPFHCEAKRKENGCLECKCPSTEAPPEGTVGCTKRCPNFCLPPTILKNGCMKCNCDLKRHVWDFGNGYY